MRNIPIKIIWLAALGLTAAAPKRADMRFEPFEGLKALRVGYDGVFNSVEKLAATPLEPQRAPAIKILVDEATRAGQAASTAALDLLAAGAKASDEMSKAFLGTRDEPSATEKMEEALAAPTQLKHRRTLLYKRKISLKERFERDRRRDSGRESELRQARELLDNVERGIKSHEDSLRGLADDFNDYKSAYGKAQGSLVEIEGFARELARAAEALRTEGPRAKAGADLLSVEPHHVTRGQAQHKIRPFLDAGRALYLAHDSLRNRCDDLSSRSVKFVSTYDRFEAKYAVIAKPLLELTNSLNQAETLLNSIEKWLSQASDKSP